MMIPRAAAAVEAGAVAGAGATAVTADAGTTMAFDPRNQTFYIAGPNGAATIAIAMSTIEAQRVRLANVAINYGCQLGLTLMSLIVVLLLLPTSRLRRPLHAVQLSALVVAVIRLCLLVLYFPGPLAGFYVSWTHDARPLSPADYAANTTSNAFGVVQLALVLQARAMMRTWTWGPPPSNSHSGSHSGSGSSSSSRWSSGVGVAGWCARALLALSVALAAATVTMRGVWVAQHTRLLRGPRLPTLPLPLTGEGEAAVALSAASIFFFCGLFFAHLSLHLAETRGLLAGPSRGRGRARGRRGARALSSLEILAIGNGVLMLAPSLFAGLDIAAGLGNNRVLPFDAGSWVQTLTVSGLPLIGIVAYHRGVNTRSSSRAVSLFAAGHPDNNGNDEEAAAQAAYAGSASAESTWRRRSRWEYHDGGRAASSSLRRGAGGGSVGASARSRSRAAEDEDTDDATMVGGSSSLGGGGGYRGRNNSSKDRNSGSTQGSHPHPHHQYNYNHNHNNRHLDLYHNYNYNYNYAEKNEQKKAHGEARTDGDADTDKDAAQTDDTEDSYESASEKRELGPPGREDGEETGEEEGSNDDDDNNDGDGNGNGNGNETGIAEGRTGPVGAGMGRGREWT